MKEISFKWIMKYMKVARTYSEDNTSCLSRKIGVVLVTADNGVQTGGWNGTIRKGLPNDSFKRLLHIHDDLLSDEKRWDTNEKFGCSDGFSFARKFENCGKCPRKLLDIPSGEGLEICNCSHAERNAIFNACRAGLVTIGATMFCYCTLPCHECAVAICQAGLTRIVCLTPDGEDYSKSSRHLFSEAGVEVMEIEGWKVFGPDWTPSQAGKGNVHVTD